MERHHFEADLQALRNQLLTMGGLVEERVHRAVHALVHRRRAGRAADHRHRQGGQRPPDGHRRPLPAPARHADAAGGGPAAHHLGHEDQRRPRADRRPGGQHRGERAGADPAAAAQAAHRHPAHGRHRGEDDPRRARRLREEGRRARPRRAAARRRGGRAQGPGVPRAPHLHDGRPRHHPARALAHPDQPQPGADRRPRHQHRRGRHLHRGGEGRASPRGAAGSKP